jgi:hypothetical protein
MDDSCNSCEKLKVQLGVLQTELKGLRELMDERTRAQKDALDKAADTLAKRLDAMNEFRAQIQSERNLFMTKDSADTKFAAHDIEDNLKFAQLRTDLEKLQQDVAEWKGTKLQSRDTTATIGWVIALIVGALALLINLFR